jgi:hypothetical protein
MKSKLRLLAFPGIILTLLTLSVSLSSCDEILDYLNLSDAEVAQALKEALTVGTDTSVSRGSAMDGYFGNQLIKILLPAEAQPILSVINSVPGGQTLVNEVILKVNRAAEQAATEATPIFVNAITSITIADAMGILNGNNDAATQYLKGATQEEIITAFRPHIVSSLESVGAQSAWQTLTSNYNSVAPFLGQPQVNTDLADHTTRKATDGLFVMVAEEEGKIRTDATHQVSALLQRVFGGQQ